MRVDRLTSQLQVALSDASSMALGQDHTAIEPVHLLLALLDQQGGAIRPLLMQVGFDVNRLKNELSAVLEALPKIQSPTGDMGLSQDLARLLNQADRLSQQKKDQFISSELVLLAAMDENTKVGKILLAQGVSRQALETAISNLRGGASVDDPNAEQSRQALEKYCIDLTERAEQGKLDPVIGRDDEIRRTVQVLQRRTKNNPVLIGEPGVGKTAIAEGLAQRSINGEVPDSLKGQRLLSLDMASCLLTSCTPWWVRAMARAQWMQATCSSRRWHGESCTASVPPRWTSTASTLKKTPRWSAVSRKCWWTSPVRKTPLPSCVA